PPKPPRGQGSLATVAPRAPGVNAQTARTDVWADVTKRGSGHVAGDGAEDGRLCSVRGHGRGAGSLGLGVWVDESLAVDPLFEDRRKSRPEDPVRQPRQEVHVALRCPAPPECKS